MAKKFAVYVHVPRGTEMVAFAPGDKVPDWAKDVVGDHCLEGYGAEPTPDVHQYDPTEIVAAIPPEHVNIVPPEEGDAGAGADDSGATEEEPSDYSKMSNDELRDELETRGLSKSGSKKELIARLEEYDEPGE